jgi:hypothetical protein
MNEGIPGGGCKMPAAKWKKLGKSFKVLKLWESIGPEWPQIAILLLSKDEYKKFLKNPRDFLNDHKVFDKTPTKEVSRCHLATLKRGTAMYVVIAKHEMDCTSVVTSSNNVK